MNRTITQLLYLVLIIIILLDSGHAIKSRQKKRKVQTTKSRTTSTVTKPPPEFFGVDLTESKVAALSLRRKNLIVDKTVAENLAIIALSEGTKNFLETYTIQPLDQVIKMKNNYDEMSVDLIQNKTFLKSHNGEEIQVDGPNDNNVVLANEHGTLLAFYDESSMVCHQDHSDVSFDRNKLTFVTKTVLIKYDRPSEVLKIDTGKESIEINLVTGSINGKKLEWLNDGKRAWHSAYGSVIFDYYTARIVYDNVNLTINLLHRPSLLVINSLQVNLTETPTSVKLECDVGKIEMTRNNKTEIETMELTSINGLVGKRNQIVLRKHATIIRGAEKRTMIRKSQKEVQPLLIQGMYGFMRVLPKTYLVPY